MIIYVKELGCFFRIEEREDGKWILEYAPSSSGLPRCFEIEFSPVGYMGNEVNPFDSREEALACVKGMKFERIL